jgi:hypothetical protein
VGFVGDQKAEKRGERKCGGAQRNRCHMNLPEKMNNDGSILANPLRRASRI